jgi:predicted transposase/invertase (TIGR01784 family)
VLCYTENQVPEEQKEELEKVIIEHLPKEDQEGVMRTVADYYMDQGLAEGEARGLALGMKKKTIVIAKNLLKAGISTDVIAKSTGLSVSEIKAIKSSKL